MDAKDQQAIAQQVIDTILPRVNGAMEVFQGAAAHVQALELLVLGMLAAHPNQAEVVRCFGRMADGTLKHVAANVTPETRPYLDACHMHLQRLLQAMQKPPQPGEIN